MANSDQGKRPEQLAQEEYDGQIGLLHGLDAKSDVEFELSAHDLLGDNSLKLLFNRFGPFDAGWIDDLEPDALTSHRLAAFNRKEIVSTNAITKSILRGIHQTNSTLKQIRLLLVLLVLVVMVFMFVFLLR